MERSTKLSIICPIYNEQSTIELFLNRLNKVLSTLPLDFEIIFINDGSTDNSLALLEQAQQQQYPKITIINLSRNFGKEAALTAGLDHCSGDIVIPIDADLQDPPELIPSLIEQWENGYDIVLAKRSNRDSDTSFKKVSAELFYKIHSKISKTQIPDNCGDYRLISRDVVEAIKSMPENQRFMKGVFAWVGFRTTSIEFRREARAAGVSKFSTWRLWNFALDGITNFSTAPLRVWLYVGLLVATFAFFYGGLIIIKTLIFGIDVPGYASTLTSILFLGGIQLISIGTLGEYIGRVYMEVKARPTYIIKSKH